MVNERLPEFDPPAAGSVIAFPTPSMHVPGRRLSGDMGDEEERDGDMERLAERIASGRRPNSLKRHPTA